MVDENLDMIAFQIISNVGMARSLAMEALFAAKSGDYAVAEDKLEESNKYFVEGHKVHAGLIQKEASGDKVEFSLLFMHAEDQLMSTETIALLVKEMVDIYKKLNK